jgi:hypothetical protein
MWEAIKRILSRYGFYREPSPFREAGRGRIGWHNDAFYDERFDDTPAAVKARRLAAIARERDALKEKLAKAIRDKKARQPIYKALRALSVEELNIEAGK